MPINTVKLSGYQICDYIWALNRQLNEKEREFVSDYANEPSWTIDTELLVTFNSTLMAGNMTNAATAPVEWKILWCKVIIYTGLNVVNHLTTVNIKTKHKTLTEMIGVILTFIYIEYAPCLPFSWYRLAYDRRGYITGRRRK